MSKEANVTINPDHPMHPKNIAARAAQASHQTTSTQSPSGQTQSAPQDGTTSTPDAPAMTGSIEPEETVKAGPHAGEKVTPSPELKSKVWSKDRLFEECLAFTHDFANAGNLTGRAMLAFIDRAQEIMNEYKKAKAEQSPKGRKK